MDGESGGSWGWSVFALLSAVFAALTNIFAKVGVEGIPSNMAMLVRVAVVFVVLIPIVLWRGEWINPAGMSNRTLLFLVLSGLATGASWLCYFRALQLGDASRVAPLDKLSVPLVMIFAFFFLKEAIDWKQWLGGALILAGALLMLQPAKPAA